MLDAAVLIACGVDDKGHRDILGCSVSLLEAEVHWRAFLSELKDRGLCGVELIVRENRVIRVEGDWDAVLVMHFPNRVAFIQTLNHPEYHEMHRHRAAGLLCQELITTRPA